MTKATQSVIHIDANNRRVRMVQIPASLPADCFWDGGLPVGPEYFAEYEWEAAPLQFAEAAD